MRRRAFLAGLGAAASGLAGCSTNDSTSGSTGQVTPAPVPTDQPTPEVGPPADLSPLGAQDAATFGEQHWRTLSSTPHGFTREAVVTESGTTIRRMRVTIRAATGAHAYHFTFDVEDTDRYPTNPVDSRLEIWDDGTTYQRIGRGDPEFRVDQGRAIDAPSARSAERFRIQLLFGSFQTAQIEREHDQTAFVATDLRAGRDVTPRRFRVLLALRNGRLEAALTGEPLYVTEYDLSVVASMSGQPVDVEEHVDYERLDAPMEPPDWVETAKEESS
ncbi:MAG: hypothetical protein ACI8UR_001692 [Natronomonas sp.]|jgi:hypothetical protein|uniref:hypothetical protein n=1 Tax=Natronomonas sp. TaxID=2184060 RepID=UPI0039898FB7